MSDELSKALADLEQLADEMGAAKYHIWALRLAAARARVEALCRVPEGCDVWKRTIDDALIASGLDCLQDRQYTREEARDITNRLLAWHQEVALDPAVSINAQALIDRGRASLIPPEGWRLVPVTLTDEMVKGWNRSPADQSPATNALPDWMRYDHESPEAWDRWSRESAQADWDAMLAAAPPPPGTAPKREALSEEQIVACLIEAGCLGTVKMSFESGPYCITRTSIKAERFARAIERAHGIGCQP